MKFVKLHQGSEEVLVNMSTVTEIYKMHGKRQSTLYFNFSVSEGERVHINVDESPDEIYAKVNGNIPQWG